ncbi:MAG: hypothetical protein KME42_26720 [Tildeniella nuda ZEHNDER 1965/U140]|nr:hypothetical protein [Tildeniella nuda ZEHNDER 1965/U140]
MLTDPRLFEKVGDLGIQPLLPSSSRHTASPWGNIAEAENRVLRVITLEDGVTVHNAFFDRNFYK